SASEGAAPRSRSGLVKRRPVPPIMRFALLGNHVDGLELAGALVASGRHQLLYHAATAIDPSFRERLPAGTLQVHDLEEILADPEVEMVLVASGPANRAAHLRRAAQSERHAFCAPPADDTPDAAYEVGMILEDTRHALVPLLPAAFHPTVRRLRDFLSQDRSSGNVLGEFLLLEVEFWSAGEVLLESEVASRKACLPGWDVLRALGGEIAEVSVLAPGDEILPGTALLASGRFERGGMFQTAFVPHHPEPRWRLRLVGSAGQVELLFPLGVPGPGFLSWRDESGEWHEETWDTWDPWTILVERIEEAVAASPVALAPGVASPEQQTVGRLSRAVRTALQSRPTLQRPELSWRDEVRCLELDDAARRSVRRRRTTQLEYPE